MDLGCMDLGCIEKQKKQSFFDSENTANDSVTMTSKIGKTKAVKEASQSNISALNKFTSQIKKPPHRKTSPLNWFPRKKVDSYLKRKIKLLQEVGGMNSTLDETLGDSNPHYSRILREKIAIREAAHKAMEARKAAMVEASWCRILRAARIEIKEAEALLLRAEKNAAEAFEVATAIGVIMYDKPDCPQKHYEIEMSAVNGGESTTHTVAASFETPFEVDKQVAAAVKSAFVRLANCSSINEEEFKELLRKISRNPDTGENNQELSEFSSECESDTGSELESVPPKDNFSSQDLDSETEITKARQRKYMKRQLSEKFKMTKLVDMMLERLKCLQEDELASLATIVATCGLNAALAEEEHSKQHGLVSAADYDPAVNFPRRVSSFGAGTTRNAYIDGQMRRKQVEAELPSLDKFLVKRLTRLEREVQEAKNAKRNETREGSEEKPDKSDDEKVCSVDNISSSDTTDLGSILVKHSSKFEKEIEEATKNSGQVFEKDLQISNNDINSTEVVPDFGSMLTKHSSKFEKEIEETKRRYGKLYEFTSKKMAQQDVAEVPSLDKFLVKHVSKLEREVQEAKEGRKIEPADLIKKVSSTSTITKFEESSSCSDGDQVGKENIDLNKKGNREVEMKQKEITPTMPSQISTYCSGENMIPIEQEVILETAEALSLPDGNDKSIEKQNSLDKILVKPVHGWEKEKMQVHKKKHGGNSETGCEGLDKILVKHVSRLEKEKMELGRKEEVMKVKRKDSNTNTQLEKSEGSLDQILVKHKSRLEREKMAAAQQPEDDQIKHFVARREARERELQEAWGGLSLGRSANTQLEKSEGSLDQILVKHKSRLEREKMAAAQQPDNDQSKHHVSRREARERELQEAWGGLSLGNSIRPHQSRLQRDKAAWLKAEEEERRKAKAEEL